MAATIGAEAGLFKVGLQLFTAEGPRVVRELTASGRRVFLDLKFHDIPNTVAGAVRSAAALGAEMLTVHAGGGSAMLRAAVEAAGAEGPLVLAVTVLTSMADADVKELGISATASEQVLHLAGIAQRTGCGGLVCSPQEVVEIRRRLGGEPVLVTPGIRPAGADVGDQSRIATPAEAIRAGADYLVIGRPITAAADPAAAARQIAATLS